MAHSIPIGIALRARALTAGDRLDLMLESLAAGPAPDHLLALVDLLEQADAEHRALAEA